MADEYELGAPVESIPAPKRPEYELGDPIDAEVRYEAPVIPEKFLDRIYRGSYVGQIAHKALGLAEHTLEGAKHGWGDGSLGFEVGSAREKYFQDNNIFQKPGGGTNPLMFFNETMIRNGAVALDTIFRTGTAFSGAVGGTVGGVYEMFGADQGDVKRAKRDMAAFTDIAMLVGGSAPVYRLGPGKIGKPAEIQEVGRLPTALDFQAAEVAITGGARSPEVSAKLEKLWHEHGVHPAEVAADMATNPEVATAMASKGGKLPEEYTAGKVDMPVNPSATSYKTAKGSTYTVEADGTTVRNKAARNDVGHEGDFGLKPKSDLTVYVKPEDAQRFAAPDNVSWRLIDHGDGTMSLATKNPDGRWGISPEARNVPVSTTPEIGMSPVEAWSKEEVYGRPAYRKIHLGNEITEITGRGEPPPPPYPPPKNTGDLPPYEPRGAMVRVGDDPPAGGGGKPPGPPGGKPPAPPPPERGPNGELNRAAAEKMIDDRISVGEGGASRIPTWKQFYTYTVDRLFPALDEIRGAVGGKKNEPETADHGYRLMRMVAGWAGKADTFINQGPRNLFTYKTVGEPLAKILGEVKSDLKDFRRFIVGARSAELEARLVETGVPQEAARKIVMEDKGRFGAIALRLVEYQNNVAAYYRDSGMLSKRGFEAMTEANKVYFPFNRVMQLEEGRRIQGVGDSLQPGQVVRAIIGSDGKIIDPIESIIKNTYMLMATAEKNIAATKLVDTLLGDAPKGKGNALIKLDEVPGEVDPNVFRQLRQAGVASDDLAEMIARHNEPVKEGQIRIFRDGVAETYLVDPDLARAVKNLDAETMGVYEKLMAPFANALRAGALMQPEFWGRHLIREPFAALVTVTKGIISPIDTVRGMVSLIMRDADFNNWMMSGGGHSSMVALDRNYLQLNLDKLTEQTGIMSRAWNVISDPGMSTYQKTAAALGVPVEAVGKYVVSPLQAMTEMTTSATKLGVYKKQVRAWEAANPNYPGGDLVLRDTSSPDAVLKAMHAYDEYYAADTPAKRAMLDAAWVSREAGQDNARMGARMQGLNSTIVFLNARVQDVDSMVRAARNDPAGFTTKVGLTITVPSLMLWHANKDDSRYQNAPDWQKDLFWLVPTDNWKPATPDEVVALPPDMVRISMGQLQKNDGTVLRIPKPFSLGVVFGSGPERLADSYFKENPRAFKNFGNTLKQSIIGDFTPTMAVPIIEHYANRSYLTNGPVIPKSLEGQLPEYQYTPYTTETSKALAQVVANVTGNQLGALGKTASNPMLIEHYIKGYTGTLGKWALEATDYGLRKAGLVPDPVNKPDKTLADIPIIRAFVARYPSAGAQPIQDFYARHEEIEPYWKTLQAKMKEGDSEAVDRVMAIGGPMVMQRLEGVRNALNVSSTLVKNIHRDPNMTSGEKRQHIDNIYYSMIEMAKAGNEFAETVKRSLKP